MSFEHQVECARSRELTALHALWAIASFQVIFAESTLAYGAVDERVAEVREVTTCFIHLRRTQNGCVNEHHVVTHLHHGAQPSIFHVAQHHRTERAVIV